jgi:hypothetical protein
MKSLINAIFIVAGGAGVAALAGCTAAEVRLPDGFASRADAWDVSGYSPRRFNQALRFGPYSALQMREGSTFSWSIPLHGVELQRSARPYAFTQAAPGQAPVEVQCRSVAWNIGRGDDSQRLSFHPGALAGPLMACGLRHGNGFTGALELSRDGTQLRGRLDGATGGYEVRSTHAMAGTSLRSSDPTGFEFRRNGTVLALVDLLNAGRVHLDRNLAAEERVYLAAAASSILLLDMEIEG